MTSEQENHAEKTMLNKTFSIRVIGVGGAGGNAVGHLWRESLAGVTFAVANTDTKALSHSPVERKLILGSKSIRGLGAGGDPEVGKSAAEEDVEELRNLCAGADIVFVVAGLGGGTGTGASPVLARVAKESGALVLGIVMLPFECEGLRRQRRALLGLHELKSAADGVIILPNQRVFKLIDEKTSLLDAFQITNELIAEGVRGIWRLLSQPGLINIDFADLCTVAQGRHAESVLASAEAKGENRSREVIEKLLAHPLLDGGQALTESTSVLVCIAGGPDLTMTEVNRVMDQINRMAEHAQITMGASISEELRERLSVTLVASCRLGGSGSGAAAEELECSRLAEAAEAEQETGSGGPARSASRFAAPPPSLSSEKAKELFSQQAGSGGRHRKSGSRLRQGQLPLEIVSKGRFEKSEPTIHRGEDLDVPTYIRRGLALN